MNRFLSRTAGSVVIVSLVGFGLLAAGGCGDKESATPDPSTGYNPDAGKAPPAGVPAATGAHSSKAAKPPKAE